MTTLAELVAAEPVASHGMPIQFVYGAGQWRFAVEIADPLAGASVAWHDITDYYVSDHDERGSDEPHGKFKSSATVMQLAARGDDLAPRNTDNSAVFGVHVPLRAGRLVRAGAFRVVSGSVDMWLPSFTKQVEQWRAATLGIGQTLRHEVTLVDLHTELWTHVIGAQLTEGWYSRVESSLVGADWPFGYDIYGASTASDLSALLMLPEIDAMPTQSAIDGATDPADIVWRPTKTGKLLFHPHPDETWHTAQFAASSTGDTWTNPLLTLYPNGVTFSHDATGDEVPILLAGASGDGFDIDSDIEGVVNHVQVSDPSGIVYDEDNPTSVSTYRGTRTKSVSWLVANDDAADRIIATQSFGDLQARPIRTSMSNPGAFPAIALLDHLDPVTIKYQSYEDRPEFTGNALVRRVSHDRERIDGETLIWNSTVEVDIDADTAFETSPLLPVVNLAASAVTETSFWIEWDNPVQPSTEPTHTQKRVRELSTLWYDGQYPSGFGGTVGGLEPDTTYTYDVRLVRIVNGITTHFSPTRSVTVRTLAPTVPTDPGGGGDGGGDTTVTIPPPDDPECVLEWKLESTPDNEAAVPVWTVVDSGDQSDLTLNGDGTYSLTVDETLFEEGLIYRFASREVCGGVPGDWLYGEPFVHPGDWTAACAVPAALAVSPYTDATLKAYVPQVCQGDQIYEAVTDTLAVKGDAFSAFIIGGDVTEYALLANSEGGLLAFGQAFSLFGLGDSPKTLGIRTKVATLETLPLLMAAAGITVSIVADGSDFVFRAIAQLDAGDAAITTTSVTPIVLDQVYDLKVTYDPTVGTLALFDGETELATSTLGAAANLVQNTDAWYMGAVASGWSTDFAVWASVLVVGGAVGGVPAVWYDASDAATLTLSGSQVTAMADKGTEGVDLAPAGTGPSSGTRTVNGLNVLDFNGSQDLTATIADTYLWSDGAQDVAIFVVGVWDSGANAAFVFEGSTGEGSSRSGIQTAGSPGAVRHNITNSGGSFNLTDAGTITTGVAFLATCLLSATDDIDLSLNGGTSTTDSHPVLLNPNRLALGVYPRASKAFWLNGAVGEVRVYHAELTSGEVAAIEAELATKWGITI